MDRYSKPHSRQAAGSQPKVDSRDFFDDAYDDDADEWPSRTPSSVVRRYRSDVGLETGRAQADVQLLAQSNYYGSFPRRKSSIPARRTATRSNQGKTNRQRISETEDIPSRHSEELVIRSWPRFHWLVYVGLAMFVMTIGWFGLTALLNWWQVTQDDWHYGRPRTAQYDQVVGHNNDSPANPSHFIAQNLRRHIQIIECPAGDCSKAKIYTGPVLIGQGQDLAPVTLSFKDVNGDGKLDMIVNVQDSRFVFINENGVFRPQRPGENVQLPQ